MLRDGYLRGFLDQLLPRLVMPPPPSPRTVALSFAQTEKLTAAAQAEDRARNRSLLGPLVVFLIGSGCRVGEALGLLWGPEGLDLTRATPVACVRRETTKTDAGERVIPLDGEVAAVLRRHRLACGRPGDGTPVFAGDDGRSLKRSGRVRFGFARAAAAAGLEELTLHGLRHTHATWLAAAGVAPPVAAHRLGHADGGALFMRVYAHPGAIEADGALQALKTLWARAK